MPAIPSWTVEGVFGIARTTGTPSASRRSIAAVGIAAATESTVCSGVSSPPISPSKASMSCGLTEIDDERGACDGLAVRERDGDPVPLGAARSTRSSRRPVTTISSGLRQPEPRSPPRSASPILPPPRIAIRRASTAIPECREEAGGGARRPFARSGGAGRALPRQPPAVPVGAGTRPAEPAIR